VVTLLKPSEVGREGLSLRCSHRSLYCPTVNVVLDDGVVARLGL
jgi:hypothetical protein